MDKVSIWKNMEEINPNFLPIFFKTSLHPDFNLTLDLVKIKVQSRYSLVMDKPLTLLGLGLIKINTMSANFNNRRPSLILNN